MSTVLRRSLFPSLLFLSLLLVKPQPAIANAVSVTGTGILGGSNSDGLSLQTAGFTARSEAPDGPSVIGDGRVGIPRTFSWEANPFSGDGQTYVTFGTQFTDVLGGGYVFTSRFTIPASALLTGHFSAPVSVYGRLQAFQDLTLGQGYYTQGPLMATLVFRGSGTATFNIQDTGLGGYNITWASATFSGTGRLTTTPEPASLLLMGTGLAALALLARGKRGLS
jgi:PEP-CTERM motif-containing protein